MGLTYFLTFSRQELLSFVFNMLDEDMDGFISKIDIYKMLTMFNSGHRIFPINLMRSVEITEVKRQEKIDFLEFA